MSVGLPEELAFGGVRPLHGTVRLPGDKSISHRALLFAAIAHGTSSVSNLATGDDVKAMRTVLEALGVEIRDDGGEVVVVGAGFDGLHEPAVVLDCGNSGTAMRVLSGVLAGRAFLSILSGDASLNQRPMRRVVEPLRAMGADVDGRAGGEYAPLAIRGGTLTGGRHDLPVASAQVKSALMMAGLQASGVTEIASPAPSRDHSERMLAALGVSVDVDGCVVRVRAGAPEPFDLEVPGDPSSAAFFVVAALITPGSDLTIESVAINPSRLGFVEVLRRMGGDIDVETVDERCGEPVGNIQVRASALTATTIAGDEVPNVQDEVPALAVAAAFADGVTEVRDAAELSLKESNRIASLAEMLAGLGVAAETRPDGLVIRGGRPRAARMASLGDHRIAMAAAVAANAVDGESTVTGWPAVASSYPEFADDLGRVTKA
ncbi:MAG TPA: 3-phosphoshikimate 1-carboxyvinyltransferase [Acidimicrobiia bacterium]|nr:3-phosphoshikimate 1-carboxyvinyltransferase [Acidimicrobiia bacterium]